MPSTYYPITSSLYVYDADGIASIRAKDGTAIDFLNDVDLDRLIDVLEGVKADHERRATSVAQLDEALENRTVSAVYSGRRGCACGCRGNHSSTSRSIKTVVNKMREAAKSGFPVVVTANYVTIDTDTRVYIAYTDGRVS